jgi:hypothetical protein
VGHLGDQPPEGGPPVKVRQQQRLQNQQGGQEGDVA